MITNKKIGMIGGVGPQSTDFIYEKIIGAETVILGCTELPLAMNYEVLGSRTINSDAVLAEGIVDYYYL